MPPPSETPLLLPHSPTFSLPPHAPQTLPLFTSTFHPTPSPLHLSFTGGPISAMSFSPTSPYLLAISSHTIHTPRPQLLKCQASSENHIQLWSIPCGKKRPELQKLITHTGTSCWDLKWRPGGGGFAAALGDGRVFIWGSEEGERYLRKRGGGGVGVRVLEWRADGRVLVVGCVDGSLEVYQSFGGWKKWSFFGHRGVVMGVEFMGSGEIVTLGMEGCLKVRDLRCGLGVLEEDEDGFGGGGCCMVSVGGRVVVVGGDGGGLRVIRFGSGGGGGRRFNVQSGGFRSLCAVGIGEKIEEGGREKSLIWAGGSDGILHLMGVERSADMGVGRVWVEETLKWVVGGKKKEGGEDGGLVLEIGDRGAGLKGVDCLNGADCGVADTGEIVKKVERGVIGSEGHKRKMWGARGRRKVGSRKGGGGGQERQEGLEHSLFGEKYNQQVVISRVCVSEEGDMLAVGIDSGIVTWLKMDICRLNEEAKEESLKEKRGVERKLQNARTREEGVIKPPRKRGRPRKYPATNVMGPGDDKGFVDGASGGDGGGAGAGAGAGGVSDEKKVVVVVDAGVNRTSGTEGNERVEAEVVVDTGEKGGMEVAEKPGGKEEKKKGRRQTAAVMIGPKRKRGRPRKIVKGGGSVKDGKGKKAAASGKGIKGRVLKQVEKVGGGENSGGKVKDGIEEKRELDMTGLVAKKRKVEEGNGEEDEKVFCKLRVREGICLQLRENEVERERERVRVRLRVREENAEEEVKVKLRVKAPTGKEEAMFEEDEIEIAGAKNKRKRKPTWKVAQL